MAEPVLTAKQRQAYDLRAKGMTWAAIGAQMGCGAQSARNHVLAAVKRGLQPILSEKMFVRRRSPNAGEPRRVERMKDGEGMFEVGAAGVAEFDLVRFREMAASAGIPPRIAGAIARRVEANFGDVRKELKRLTAAQEVVEIESVRQMMLKYMDEVAVSGANIKDIAIAYGIMVDKGLLLGGKPNVVVDFNVRHRIEVLMPQMLAEARRRNITIEGEFSHDHSQPARIESQPAAADAGADENDHHDERVNRQRNAVGDG